MNVEYTIKNLHSKCLIFLNFVQMGFGMPANMEDMEAMVYGDDDDDLEAELAALTGGDTPAKKTSPNKKGEKKETVYSVTRY